MHSIPTPRTTWRRQVAAVSLAFGLVASGCGGGDDDATVTTDAPTATTATTSPPGTTGAPADTEPTTPVTTATETTDAGTAEEPATTESTDESADVTSDDGTASGGDTSAFCETVVEAETTASAGPDVDFETASEDEIGVAMEAWAAQMTPQLDRLVELAPAEVAGPVAELDRMIRGAMESGDDPFGSPEFQAADAAVDEYLIANCGFDIQDVRAVEYAFEEVPDTLDAGIHGFRFDNQGNEVHEMIVFRINDDVDASIDELLALPEEESATMTTFVAASFAEPGGTDTTFVDVEPGRYAMLCFIPVGTVDMEMLTGEEEPSGQPHFMQGMVHEFEVT